MKKKLHMLYNNVKAKNSTTSSTTKAEPRNNMSNFQEGQNEQKTDLLTQKPPTRVTEESLSRLGNHLS